MKRRDFFAVLGGGIVVLIVDDSDAQETGGGARRGLTEPPPTQVSAWLHIGETGIVTVYTGKVEVGQNSRTSLTQAAAEELRAPVASIRTRITSPSRCPVRAARASASGIRPCLPERCTRSRRRSSAQMA